METGLNDLLGRLALELGLVSKERLLGCLEEHVREGAPLSLVFFKEGLIDEDQLAAIRCLEQKVSNVQAQAAAGAGVDLAALEATRQVAGMWRLPPPTLADRVDRMFLEISRVEAGLSVEDLDRRLLKSLVPSLVYVLKDASAADKGAAAALLEKAADGRPPAESGEDELAQWEHWWTRNAEAFQRVAGDDVPAEAPADIFVVVDGAL